MIVFCTQVGHIAALADRLIVKPFIIVTFNYSRQLVVLLLLCCRGPCVINCQMPVQSLSINLDKMRN